ncbi:MAG: DUF92 domain-containing protein [Chloroflexi bacterium]|nr:DUF92 domain-containing protein [Chloroflexota bacterium]OJV91266.1 MAG: hypothetical protein BGO39_26840 [Chloroflexi bacterium 54-19]
MNPVIWRLVAGLVLSTLIGLVAYRKQALSGSGVAGAIITGSCIFGFGGWVWGLTLIAFFVYGTLLSRFKERQKEKVAAEKFEKGSRRDLGQALANGGVGAILAVLSFISPDNGWLFAGFIGAMATVNADTWATELGVLSRSAPRLLTTGRQVPPGTSGGITALGTLATVLGGLAIGLTAWALLVGKSWLQPGTDWAGSWWLVPVGAAAGLVGSLADSLLGATVQAMYTQAGTGQATEKKFDRQHRLNPFRRGWPFMNNDAVNFCSSVIGAAGAAALYLLLV